MLPGLILPQTGRHAYATDFREYATAAQPADWTKRGSSTANLTVSCTADGLAPGGRYMSAVKATTDDYTYVTWNRLPSHTDIDLVIAVREENAPTASSNAMLVVCRSDANGSTPTEYFCTLNTDGSAVKNTFSLAKRVAGTGTVLATTAAISWSLGTWYFMRLQVIGSNLKAKFWAVGTAEPGAWTLTVSDASIASGTYAGLLTYYGSSYAQSNRVGWFAAALSSTVSAPLPQG